MKTITDSLNETLNNYFKVSEYTGEKLLRALSLLVFSFNIEKDDLYILAKLLNPEQLDKLIYYYNGTSLRIPSIEDYKRSKIIVSCFYLREIKGWRWPDIREFLNLTEDEELEDSPSKSVAAEIRKMKEELKPEFFKILNEEFDFMDVIKRFANEK